MGAVTSLRVDEVKALCKAASVDEKTAPGMVVLLTSGPKSAGKERLHIYRIYPGPAVGPEETPQSVANFVVRLSELDAERKKFVHVGQFSASVRIATVQFP